jgi:hypothetical protein
MDLPSLDQPPPDVTPAVKRKSTHRSRVANGSKLLPLTDCRSASARRFKDLIDDITSDLGGVDQLSEGQRQLIRRAAMLSAELERQEALWSRGVEGVGKVEFDINAYSTMTNSLGRVLDRLGIKRAPRQVEQGPLHAHFAATTPKQRRGPLVAHFTKPLKRRKRGEL